MTSCPRWWMPDVESFFPEPAWPRPAWQRQRVVPSPAESAPAPARVEYPSNRLANVRDLKVNEPLECRLSGSRMRRACC